VVGWGGVWLFHPRFYTGRIFCTGPKDAFAAAVLLDRGTPLPPEVLQVPPATQVLQPYLAAAHPGLDTVRTDFESF